MEEITTLISNVGFPIACCVILFINNAKFTEVLNKINISLTELCDRLEVLEKEAKDK